jgi:uncharacterized membrane protein YkvA (DUF1232 family)
MLSILSLAHVLVGEPVSTSPEHALAGAMATPQFSGIEPRGGHNVDRSRDLLGRRQARARALLCAALVLVEAAALCGSAAVRRVQAALLGALAYFVLPFDIVPDMLPVLGFTDDAAVLATALKLVASHMRPEHRAAAKAAIARGLTED